MDSTEATTNDYVITNSGTSTINDSPTLPPENQPCSTMTVTSENNADMDSMLQYLHSTKTKLII